MINFFFMVAEEMRGIMASLGFTSINQMVGHSEVLEVPPLPFCPLTWTHSLPDTRSAHRCGCDSTTQLSQCPVAVRACAAFEVWVLCGRWIQRWWQQTPSSRASIWTGCCFQPPLCALARLSTACRPRSSPFRTALVTSQQMAILLLAG